MTIIFFNEKILSGINKLDLLDEFLKKEITYRKPSFIWPGVK
jgi:hypothetical protein